MKSKGQAAIEYMTVIGIALLLSLPFIMKTQQSIIELQTGSNSVEIQNTLNNIETAVETVSASGEPATRTFIINMPETLNSTEVGQNYVRVVLNTGSGVNRYSRSFGVNVTGSLPDDPGPAKMKVQAKDGEVVIEVVA